MYLSCRTDYQYELTTLYQKQEKTTKEQLL